MFVSLAEYKHAVYVTQKNGWMMSMWADKIEYIWHRNHAERGRKYDLAHDTRYKFDEVLVLVYVYVYKEYSKRIEVVVELTKPTKPKQRARRSSSNTHTHTNRETILTHISSTKEIKIGNLTSLLLLLLLWYALSNIWHHFLAMAHRIKSRSVKKSIYLFIHYSSREYVCIRR